jgi:hypothetical protein
MSEQLQLPLIDLEADKQAHFEAECRADTRRGITAFGGAFAAVFGLLASAAHVDHVTTQPILSTDGNFVVRNNGTVSSKKVVAGYATYDFKRGVYSTGICAPKMGCVRKEKAFSELSAAEADKATDLQRKACEMVTGLTTHQTVCKGMHI